VTPRRYTLGRRQQTADETRARIIGAARTLLAEADGGRAFTIDGVAREADVTRVTVYQHFETKQRLLGAVLDQLATEGGLPGMRAALADAPPEQALDQVVATIVRFWASDRTLHRHLGALADIDPELRDIVHERRERRRATITLALSRVDPELTNSPARMTEAVDAVFALTSPTMLDALAGQRRSVARITQIVQRLARAAIPPESG
jgi:AcrR family transcriptional regulator